MLGVFSVYEWTRGTQGIWEMSSQRTGGRPGTESCSGWHGLFLRLVSPNWSKDRHRETMGWHGLYLPPRSRERVSAGHRLVVPPATQTFPASEPFRDSQTRNRASSIAPRLWFHPPAGFRQSAMESEQNGFRGAPEHSRRSSAHPMPREALGNAESSRSVPVDSESVSGHGSGEGIA